MGTVKLLLDRKGHDIWSIAPDASVYDAIHLMAEKEIGALVVLEGSKLVGIISERDYARDVILKGRSSEDTKVSEIMSTGVITAGLQDTTDKCMSVMTEHHIRHLPVTDGSELLGVLSIGDLVRSVISEQQDTIDDLQRYIKG